MVDNIGHGVLSTRIRKACPIKHMPQL